MVFILILILGSLTILVSSLHNITFFLDSNQNCSVNCDGSELLPFPDLFYGLYFIENMPNLPSNFALILKNEYYLLTDDSIQPYLNKMQLEYYWPAFLSLQNKTFKIKSILEKSKILVKTTKINFYLNSTFNLSLENIAFYGNDLNLNPMFINSQLFNCYYSNNFCCNFNGFADQNINTTFSNFDFLCKFDSRYTILQPTNSFSFFTLLGNNSLTIINCMFVNYYLYSFATVNSGLLIINSTQFLNISSILYFMSFDQSEFIINDSIFDNILFNSSDPHTEMIIYQSNSFISWHNITLTNIDSTRNTQTLISLQEINYMIIMNSNISTLNDNDFILIKLDSGNNLLIYNTIFNRNPNIDPNLHTYNDFYNINFMVSIISANDNNIIILSNLNCFGVTMKLFQSNSIFIRNSILTFNYGRDSGFLYTESQNLMIIKNSTFKNSAGISYSGLVSMIDSNQLIILNISSFYCSSYLFGGCFYVEQNNTVFLKNSNFSLNSVNSNGGLFYIDMSNYLYFCKVILNSSITPLEGGAIAGYQNNTIIILYSFFFKCQSSYHGGAINLQYENTLISINSSFDNISAEEEGGVIYLNSLNKMIFINTSNSNSISQSEGGFLLASDQNNITIQFCKFNTSFSLRQGGYILATSGNQILISYSDFMKVTTGERGLYFYAYKSNKFYIYQVMFEGSELMERGSAFFFDYNNSVCFNSSLTKDNSDTNEMMIHLNNKNSIKIINCTFNESTRNHTYVIYAETNNFIFWMNSTALIYDIDYLTYFFKTNHIYLFNQQIKNFKCNQNLISISSYSIIIVENVIVKYDSLTEFKLFDIFLSGLSIKNSKFYFYNTSFILANIQIGCLLIKNTEIIRNSIQKDFTITCTIAAIIQLNKTYSYNNNFYLENTKLYVVNSTFFSSKTIGNGGVFQIIIFYNDTYVFNEGDNVCIFIRNKFLLNNANEQGGVIHYSIQSPPRNNLSFVFFMSNCAFFNNKASKGPAFYIFNPTYFLVQNTNFTNNQAFFKGNPIGMGGCFYISLMNNQTIFILLNNNFDKNKANIGNIIFFEGEPKIDVNTFFLSNKINSYTMPSKYFYYGEIMASTVKSLQFYETPKIRFYFIDNIVIGKNYDYCLFTIFPYDYFGNFAFHNNENILSSLLNDYKNQNISLIANLVATNNLIQKDGYLCITGSFLVNSISDIEQIFKYSFYYDEQLVFYSYADQTLNLKIKVRSCLIGQRLTDSLTCEDCQMFFFSFNREFIKTTTCQPCLSIYPFNCFGGFNLTIKPGYWRSSKMSTNFLKCPILTNCLGDTRNFDINTPYMEYYSTVICEIGYTGPLCSVCDIGYGSVGNYVCAKCDTNSYYLRLFFVFFLSFLFVFYTIHKNLRMCINLYYKSIDIKDMMSTYLLKIFLNHCEVLIIILNLPLEWPSFTDEMKNFLDGFMQSVNGSSSWECLLKSDGIFLPMGYFNFFEVFALQIFILFSSFFYLFFFLQTYKKSDMTASSSNKSRITLIKRFSGITIVETLKTIFLMIFSMNFSTLVKRILEMTNCQEINDTVIEQSDLRLIVDYSINYRTPFHLGLETIVVTPCLIICGLFPLVILFILHRKHKNKTLYTKWSCFYYGYFFYAYEEKFYYWDFVIFVRRLLLVTLGTFFMNLSIYIDTMVPLTSMLVVLLISYVLQIRVKPFNKNNLLIINKIEKFSLITLTLTLYVTTIYVMKKNQFGLFQYSYQNALGAIEDLIPETLKQILLVFIIVINFLFFLFWTRYFFSTIDWKIIKQYILKFSPICLEKYLKKLFFVLKNLKFWKHFIAVRLTKLYTNISIFRFKQIKKFEKCTSPTLESYMKRNFLKKEKKFKKKINNFKEFLSIQHIQIKLLKKSVNALTKENENLKNQLKSFELIKETHESQRKIKEKLGKNESKKSIFKDIPDKFLNTDILCLNEISQINLDENTHLKLSFKGPKQIFSSITNFFKFTLIFENISSENLKKIKLWLQKSSNFIMKTNEETFEISPKTQTKKIKIFYYITNKIIQFPHISISQRIEPENYQTSWTLPIPFQKLFNFYNFDIFSQDHNLMDWNEFYEKEKLEEFGEIVCKTLSLRNIFTKIFRLETNEKIPHLVIFKMKSKSKIEKGWYSLNIVFKDMAYINFYASHTIKNNIKEGVKRWIITLFNDYNNN